MVTLFFLSSTGPRLRVRRRGEPGPRRALRPDPGDRAPLRLFRRRHGGHRGSGRLSPGGPARGLISAKPELDLRMPSLTQPRERPSIPARPRARADPRPTSVLGLAPLPGGKVPPPRGTARWTLNLDHRENRPRAPNISGGSHADAAAPERSGVAEVEAWLLGPAAREDDLLLLFESLIWNLIASGLPHGKVRPRAERRGARPWTLVYAGSSLCLIESSGRSFG